MYFYAPAPWPVRFRLLVALALAVAALGGCRRGETDRLSVLLVTIDTCRDDHVGQRAGGDSVTPHLDALAREGRRVAVAIAPSCFTAPSMTSISTGVYPENHGVLEWGVDGRSYGRPGLAARYRDAGYRTAFVSGHGGLGGIVPLLDGFDHVRDSKDASAPEVTRQALEWLDRARRDDPSRPVFLWVHYFDPHSPYAPPERSAGGVLGGAPFDRWRSETFERMTVNEQIAALETLYRGEVAEVDLAIGDLLASVRRGNGADRWLVAVTADHGENLSDHEPRFAHHDALFDSLVRVPLFLAGPGVAELPLDADVPVEVIRLAPTLLDLCGIRYGASDFDRVSLRRGAGDGFAYLHTGLQENPHAALRSADAKVVLELETGRRAAFDLRADPGEQRAVDPASTKTFLELSRALEWLRGIMPGRGRDPGAADSLPRDLREWLEQLGYLGRRDAGAHQK